MPSHGLFKSGVAEICALRESCSFEINRAGKCCFAEINLLGECGSRKSNYMCGGHPTKISDCKKSCPVKEHHAKSASFGFLLKGVCIYFKDFFDNIRSEFRKNEARKVRCWRQSKFGPKEIYFICALCPILPIAFIYIPIIFFAMEDALASFEHLARANGVCAKIPTHGQNAISPSSPAQPSSLSLRGALATKQSARWYRWEDCFASLAMTGNCNGGKNFTVGFAVSLRGRERRNLFSIRCGYPL